MEKEYTPTSDLSTDGRVITKAEAIDDVEAEQQYRIAMRGYIHLLPTKSRSDGIKNVGITATNVDLHTSVTSLHFYRDLLTYVAVGPLITI